MAAKIQSLRSAGGLPPPEILEELEAAAEEPEAGARRRGPRSLTVIWVLLAVAASLYRACTAPG